MSNSNSSSTSDLIYVNPDSTLTESFSSLTALKPISNSILLDHCRLPPRKPSTKTVLITRYPSTSTTSGSSLDHPRLYRSVSSLGATHEERMNNTRNALSFAPLPQGKPRRSNSITLGVAARAKMIQSQGGGSNRSQPRYSGKLIFPCRFFCQGIESRYSSFRTSSLVSTWWISTSRCLHLYVLLRIGDPKKLN
jgi:hypothetical protein